MTGTPKLRAGLIGLGAMGRNHARVLQIVDGVELVGVAEPNGDGNNVLRGIPVFATAAELIGVGLDYAVVCCPTGLHEEIGLQLAEAGVPALIEKPLAPSVEASRRLVDAFESAGLVARQPDPNQPVERCKIRAIRGKCTARRMGGLGPQPAELRRRAREAR